MLHGMRRTKIICTLGPATERSEILRQMMSAGADVFRLNMSHATQEWVREIVPRIRQIAQELKRPVAILLDTQGPAIRTGDLKTDLHLKPGDVLEFTVRGARSEEANSIDVNYDGLVNDISVGDTVLVDNGAGDTGSADGISGSVAIFLSAIGWRDHSWRRPSSLEPYPVYREHSNE